MKVEHVARLYTEGSIRGKGCHERWYKRKGDDGIIENFYYGC